MSTKFDEYPNDRKLRPDEEDKITAIILLVFVISAIVAVVGFVVKVNYFAILGCMGLLLTSFYVIPFAIDMLKKSKQAEREYNKQLLEEIKKENAASQKEHKEITQTKNEDYFDIVQAIMDEFEDEVDASELNKGILIFHKQSDYLFDICLKFDFKEKTMKLYCPFFYPKALEETDIPYGVYLEKLHEYLNDLNVKYIPYKFFTRNSLKPIGYVSRDYPLIENDSILNFLKGQINLMLKLLDEVYAEMPQDYA